MSAVLLAQEPRLRTGIAYVGYVPPVSLVPWGEPEIDVVNALPRIRTPVLMLNGQFDTAIPPGSDTLFFNLLGTPAEDKRHIVESGGHFIQRKLLIQETLLWLDKYLGVPRGSIATSAM